MFPHASKAVAVTSGALLSAVGVGAAPGMSLPFASLIKKLPNVIFLGGYSPRHRKAVRGRLLRA
jgi:hypothetical protein